MTPTLSIEPMAGRHVAEVRAIDEQAYGNPWSVATWRRELAADDRLHFVADDGTVLVGHAGLLFVLDEVHVTTVAVCEERRGQGIATRLLLTLLDEARAHGSAAATLEVRASDRRAHRIYSRFGFRPAGVRRGYYTGPADDALVMWLHDLGGFETGDRLDRIRRELTEPEVTRG